MAYGGRGEADGSDAHDGSSAKETGVTAAGLGVRWIRLFGEFMSTQQPLQLSQTPQVW